MEANKPSMVEGRRARQPTVRADDHLVPQLSVAERDCTCDPHLNLAGLPPVTLISADVDPLISDADMLERNPRRFFRIVAKAGAARDLAVSHHRCAPAARHLVDAHYEPRWLTGSLVITQLQTE
jgi:hypothetical protein